VCRSSGSDTAVHVALLSVAALRIVDLNLVSRSQLCGPITHTDRTATTLQQRCITIVSLSKEHTHSAAVSGASSLSVASSSPSRPCFVPQAVSSLLRPSPPPLSSVSLPVVLLALPPPFVLWTNCHALVVLASVVQWLGVAGAGVR
jgi:hypothetical protein